MDLKDAGERKGGKKDTKKKIKSHKRRMTTTSKITQTETGWTSRMQARGKGNKMPQEENDRNQ
jgi:hypothetical protein